MNIVNETNVLLELLRNCSHVVGEVSCYRRPLIGNVFGSLVTFLVSLTAVFCNISVIFVSFWSKTLREQTGNLFIVSLSAVDVLTGITVMAPSAIAVALDHWPFGEAICKLHSTMNYGCACSSTNILAAISLDRVFAVLSPFKYQAFVKKYVAVMACSFALTIGFSVASSARMARIQYDYGEAMCALDYKNDPKAIEWVHFAFISCFSSPALIMTVSNVVIAVVAERSQRRVQPLFARNNRYGSSSIENQSESSKLKTVKSMSVVIITYYICFTPYAIGKVLKTVFEIDVPFWFDYLTSIFVFISSATNPFIYGIFRKDYRDAYKKLFKIFARKLCPDRIQNRIHPS